MSAENEVLNGVAETFLTTCLGPWYEARPDKFIVPYFSDFPNLGNTAGGHAAFIPNPDPITVRFNVKDDFTLTDGKKRYAYVPPKITVALYYEYNGQTLTLVLQSTGIYDLQRLYIQDGTSIYDNMNAIEVKTSYKDWTDVVAEVCLGTSVYYLGGTPYVGLAPQGEACDVFYENRCTDESPHVDDLACSCIVENRALQAKYPNSQTQVTCLGRRCGLGGYKTKFLSKEQCSIAYCSDFLLTSGENLEYGNDTEIYCAGRSWRRKDQDPSGSLQPIIATTIYEQQDNRTTPDYLWIILAIALLVFGLLAYLVFK